MLLKLRRLSRDLGSVGSLVRLRTPLRNLILSFVLTLSLAPTLLPAATATWQDPNSQPVQFTDNTTSHGLASSTTSRPLSSAAPRRPSGPSTINHQPSTSSIGGPVVTVPEPSTMAVIATGLLLLVVVSHSRKRRR